MDNQKISQYTNTSVTINDNDLYDVSVEISPGVFETQKISGATLKDKLQKVPAGGTAGQMLVKVNSSDFNLTWMTPPIGIPAGGLTGQVLSKVNDSHYNVQWATPAGGGGNIGKILLIKPGQNAVQYATFALANADAVAGDSIWGFEGVYNENNIAKNGVKYFLWGVEVNYTGADTTPVINLTSIQQSWIYGNAIFKSTTAIVVQNAGTLNLQAKKLWGTSTATKTLSSTGTIYSEIDEIIDDAINGSSLQGNIYGTFGSYTRTTDNIAPYHSITVRPNEGSDIVFGDIVTSTNGITIATTSNKFKLEYNNIDSTLVSIIEDGSFSGEATIINHGKTTSSSSYSILKGGSGTIDFYGFAESLIFKTIYVLNGILNFHKKAEGGTTTNPVVICAAGSGTFNLKKDAEIIARFGDGIDHSSTSDVKLIIQGRVEELVSGKMAIILSGPGTIIFKTTAEIVTHTGNDFSINGGTGKIIKTYGTPVANKPFNNITETVSLFIIDPLVV